MDPIFTERLILRRPSGADLSDFLEYRNDPESMELQGLETMEHDAALGFLERQASLDPRSQTGWIMFAVEVSDSPGLTGEVGMFIQPDGKQGDMGWSFAAANRGKGYATEAARATLEFAFTVRGLHRVTATCESLNEPSIRVMQRLGMRHEATHLQSRFRGGAWRDESVYALLRDEFFTSSR